MIALIACFRAITGQKLTPLLALTILAILPAIVNDCALASDNGTLQYSEVQVETAQSSGLNLFLVDLYNQHRGLYALLAVVSMAISGIAAGWLAGIAFKLFGFNHR